MTAHTEKRWYVGAVDEIETLRLDGTSVIVARGEAIECTADDAAFYDLQPDNWSADPPDGPAAPKVADVIADVGGDPEKAERALLVERARSSGPRSTLVKQLEAVIADASAATDDTDRSEV